MGPFGAIEQQEVKKVMAKAAKGGLLNDAQCYVAFLLLF